MRTLNSAKNLASSLSITITMTLLGFFTRKVFVDNVGVEYLGLNGLLQNILGMVTLLEGGFGTSVVYNLYKPLAERNEEKIIALLQLYRKVYRFIALGVITFALCLFPFIDLFIKDAENLSYVSIVYFIFLFNSVIQYFTAYKWSLINADQKNYKLTTINLVYQVGLNLTKLFILYYTKNYILYLVVEALFGVGLNYATVKKANQLYPFIQTKKKFKVEDSVKKNIVMNVKALFFHSLGGYFMHSTSNIVISSFVGIAVVGLYSNYTLLTGLVTTFSNQVLNSFSESVGNLVAVEKSDHSYEVFKTVFFLNFVIISSLSILVFNVITPFISWWLGEEYLLGITTLSLILLNFYINNMRNSIQTFKVKSGIFTQDRFSPLLQGVINLCLSLILVRFWGIDGVLFAFGFSILCIGFWQYPRLVYKYTFHRPLWNYFKWYITYTFCALIALGISSFLISYILVENKLLQSIVNGFVTVVVIGMVYMIAFIKHRPCISLLTYVRTVVDNVRKK